MILDYEAVENKIEKCIVSLHDKHFIELCAVLNESIENILLSGQYFSIIVIVDISKHGDNSNSKLRNCIFTLFS